MKRKVPAVLGGMSVDRFLSEFWQKKALVIRGAFPGLKDPLSPDELAGLACSDDVESRLIVRTEPRGRQKERWRVTRGPQRSQSLRRLPRTGWTLLVESMDRHSTRIAALAKPFAFIPKWRMDDVMVSLAPEEGTVDAHIDSYDVFLIQGQGRRRWEVDSRARPAYKPGIDLRILRSFRAESTWTLNPGDMLYVPPGCGHRGVTVASDAAIALTYSVGFRAPSDTDLFSSLISRTLTRQSPRLFPDAGRRAAKDPTEITAADLRSLKAFVTDSVVSLRPDDWILTAGEAVTTGVSQAVSTRRVHPPGVVARLAAGFSLTPSPEARLSWARLGRGRAALFVNGESRVFERRNAFAAFALCGTTSPSVSRRLARHDELARVVVELLRARAIQWSR